MNQVGGALHNSSFQRFSRRDHCLLHRATVIDKVVRYVLTQRTLLNRPFSYSKKECESNNKDRFCNISYKIGHCSTSSE